MKRYHSLFIAALLCVVFCNRALSQDEKKTLKKPGLFLGASFLYSSPKGSFSNSYKGGAGGELIGGLGYGKTFLTAAYGSGRFFSKPGVSDITYKPLKIGLRQFIIGKMIFAAVEVGSASVNDKNKGITTNDFIYAFGGGLRFTALEAGIYYNTLKADVGSNQNFVQYKVGWNFML